MIKGVEAASSVGGLVDVNVTYWEDDAVPATSGGVPNVNVTQISGDSTAADNAELAFDGTGYGFTGCTMPTVTTLTGHTAQTGDNYARLGAPAGASIAADIAENQVDLNTIDLLIDAIKAKTDNLQLEATTNYIKSVPQDFEDVSIGDGDTLGSGKAGEALRWLRWFIKNTWDVDDSPAPDEMNIYKDDGTTKGYCFQVYTSSNHNYRKVVACS